MRYIDIDWREQLKDWNESDLQQLISIINDTIMEKKASLRNRGIEFMLIKMLDRPPDVG